MFGQTMALLTRTLREDTRLLRASLVRLGVLVIIAWLLLIAHAEASRRGAPGLFFFSAITFLNLFVISLAGMSFFATVITEEKEERTLGLLRMAGVGTLTILLGKSTSRLLVAVLVLTLEVPFILLSVTLGGVLLHQVAAAYCTLVAFLLSVSNAALVCSVVCRSSRRASTVMTILLAAFLLAPPLLLDLIQTLRARGIVDDTAGPMAAVKRAAESINELSPFSRIGEIISTGFSDSLVGYHVLCHLAAAALFFVLSWVLFGFCTRNDEPAVSTRKSRIRRSAQVGRAWQRALVWKDFNFHAGGWPRQVLLFLGLGTFILMLHLLVWLSWQIDYGVDAAWKQVGKISFYVGLWCFIIQAAVSSGRIFRDEVQAQTLSAICLLPQTTHGVIRSKLIGCGLGLLPAVTWIAVGITLYPEGTIGEYFEPDPNNTAYWMWAVMFLVFLHASAYLSMVVKWGGAPLAFVIVFVGGHLIVLTVVLVGEMMRASPNESAVFGLFCVIYLIPIPFLYRAVIRRLEAMAAQ